MLSTTQPAHRITISCHLRSNLPQSSLDSQYTSGNWLGKVEAIARSGHGPLFGALVGGFENTLVGVFGTRAELGILVEYLYDGQHEEAPPMSFDDDTFVGARLTLTDPQSTSALLGAVIDRRDFTMALSFEASRRLGECWTFEIEARGFVNTSESDVLFGFR